MGVSLHIFIAITSLLLVAYSLIKTSRKTIMTGYVSVVFTLVSGICLVWSQPARMLHTCVAGLIYLALAMTALMVARVRLLRVQHNGVI